MVDDPPPLPCTPILHQGRPLLSTHALPVRALEQQPALIAALNYRSDSSTGPPVFIDGSGASLPPLPQLPVMTSFSESIDAEGGVPPIDVNRSHEDITMTMETNNEFISNQLQTTLPLSPLPYGSDDDLSSLMTFTLPLPGWQPSFASSTNPNNSNTNNSSNSNSNININSNSNSNSPGSGTTPIVSFSSSSSSTRTTSRYFSSSSSSIRRFPQSADDSQYWAHIRGDDDTPQRSL